MLFSKVCAYETEKFSKKSIQQIKAHIQEK